MPHSSTSNTENVQVVFNDDSSAPVKPPKDFLVNARRNWDSSLIGHFIGGNFAFQFVKDQAFKLWKNMGLSRVFYSSKGYYTFKFNIVKEKNEVLGLHSIQLGGKTLYLMPWMEGNKFKRNVIHIVPC